MKRFLVNIYVVPYQFYLKRDPAGARAMAHLVCVSLAVLAGTNYWLLTYLATGKKLLSFRSKVDVIQFSVPVALSLFGLTWLLVRLNPHTRNDQSISRYASTVTASERQSILALFAINVALFLLIITVGRYWR